MTDYKIVIAAQAKDDMLTILRYVSDCLHEPQTAQRLYQTIQSEIYTLEQMPERYPLLEEKRCRALGVRKLLVKNYLVLYRVDKAQRLVQILRIIYAGRNLSAQIEGTDWDNL